MSESVILEVDQFQEITQFRLHIPHHENSGSRGPAENLVTGSRSQRSQGRMCQNKGKHRDGEEESGL